MSIKQKYKNYCKDNPKPLKYQNYLEKKIADLELQINTKQVDGFVEFVYSYEEVLELKLEKVKPVSFI